MHTHTAQKKIALVLGASGLVGAQVTRQLLDSPIYSSVVALVRKPLPYQHPKLRQEIFDFDHPDASKVRGDDLFSCLGTTARKAGSEATQYKIGCSYPAEIGRIARENGVERYLLVSSIGADAKSSNFYLKTKGELEEKVRALDFPLFVSLRPSFLLGDREEFRLGERIGIFIAYLLHPFLLGPLRKYRGVRVEKVAATMIRMANDDLRGTHFVESNQIR